MWGWDKYFWADVPSATDSKVPHPQVIFFNIFGGEEEQLGIDSKIKADDIVGYGEEGDEFWVKNRGDENRQGRWDSFWSVDGGGERAADWVGELEDKAKTKMA